MKFYFDTSVLVAATVSHHPHHAAGITAYRQVVTGRHSGVVSAHGLAETFAVLTRLPLSPMIHPSEAYRIIQETVVAHCKVQTLDEDDYLSILESASSAGLRGGVVYDALHLRSAEKAHCDRVYTFNLSHFTRLAPHLQNKLMRP